MIKIAMYQECAAPVDVEQNCWKVVQESEYAIKNGARLICFPEWFLSGFDLDYDYFFKQSAIDGGHRVWQKLQALCEVNQVAIVVGGLEKYLRRHYNTIFAISDRGERDLYRKQQPYWLEKGLPLGYGDQPVVFNALGLRIGLLTGSDLFSDNVFRIYQRSPCDLYVVCSALADVESMKLRSGIFTFSNALTQLLPNRLSSTANIDSVLVKRAKQMSAPFLFCNQGGWSELPVPWLPIHFSFPWYGRSQLVQPDGATEGVGQSFRGWTFLELPGLIKPWPFQAQN